MRDDQAAGRPAFPGTIRGVMEAVAVARGTSAQALRSPARHHPLVHVRQEAIYCARVITGASTTVIGRVFGNRDHTTILHACRAHAARAGWPAWYKADAAALRAALGVARPAPVPAWRRVQAPGWRRCRMVAARLGGASLEDVCARYGVAPGVVREAEKSVAAWAGTDEPGELAVAVAARLVALEAMDGGLPGLARACAAEAAASAAVPAHRIWSADRSPAVTAARGAAVRLVAARSRASQTRIAATLGISRASVRRALMQGGGAGMTHPRERLGPVRLAMLAAVLGGEPVEAVAARGGVTRKTLLGVVALARRQAGTAAPAALAAWARRRAAEIGSRPARVEAAVRAAVAAWAPRYGVPPHQVYGPGRTRALSAVRAHAIRAGAAAGGTAAQIGRVLGLAESSVYYVLAGGKTARAAA